MAALGRDRYFHSRSHEEHIMMMRVARTGFEPVVSALRGQCPRPLDERAEVSD